MLFSPLERAFRRYQRTANPSALAFVFDRTAEPLARIARHLASNEASAEDLVQATFLTAIEKARTHEPEREVLPWLVGILSVHAREARRRSARRHTPPSPGEEAASDPAREAEDRELATLLARSIEGLPGTYRPVLALLLDGFGTPEIAARLGRAPGTVRVQLARGLAQLRRALPAGLALGVGSALDAHGLARVRARVLASAGPASLPHSAALAATGVLLMTARTKFAVVALLIAALLALVPRLRSSRAHEDEGGTARAPAELVAPDATAPAAPLDARPVAEQRVALAREERESLPEPAPASDARSELELEILRGESGPPLAGAGVRLARTDRGQDLLGTGREERTDAAGRVRFRGLEPGAYVVHLDRWAGLGVVRVPEERARTLIVPAGCRVVGRVVDPAGTPVAGARVLAHGNLLWPTELARTDERGEFELDGLASYLSLAAEAEGFLPSELREVRGAAGAEIELELALRARARRVSGTVLDTDGVPSPGACVVLQTLAPSPPDDGPRSGAQFTRCDDDGRFVFAAASAAAARVFAIPAHAGTLAPGGVALAAGTTDVDTTLVLRRGAAVEGRVHEGRVREGESDAEPRPARAVHAYPLQPRDDLGPLVTWFGVADADVDASGAYRLEGLLPGAYELVLASQTGELARTTIELAESARERWDVRLDEETLLAIHVQPPTPPSVFLGLWMVNLLRTEAGHVELETARVVPAEGRLVLTTLAPGPYEVALSGTLASVPSSRIVLAQRAQVWRGDELAFTLAEPPSASVRGRLAAAPGATAGGQRVYLSCDDTRPSSYVDAVTDESGAFALGPLPAGHYRVAAGALAPFEFDLAATETRELGWLDATAR